MNGKLLQFVRFGLALLLLSGAAATGDEPEPEFQPPADLPDGWYARIETGKGRIIARLLPEQAPQSVAHFVGLAEGTLEWIDVNTGETRKERYYDGTLVNLAEAGQRFEAGDLAGTGRGTPFLYVPPMDGIGAVNFSGAGRLGMTRAPGNKVSAVKFFVSVSTAPWLNRRHPCFGVVMSGKEVAFQISQVTTYSNGRPVEPITIDRIRIFSVGEVAELPEPEAYTPSAGQLQLRPGKAKK